jgi:hypothetical protein
VDFKRSSVLDWRLDPVAVASFGHFTEREPRVHLGLLKLNKISRFVA